MICSYSFDLAEWDEWYIFPTSMWWYCDCLWIEWRAWVLRSLSVTTQKVMSLLLLRAHKLWSVVDLGFTSAPFSRELHKPTEVNGPVTRRSLPKPSGTTRTEEGKSLEEQCVNLYNLFSAVKIDIAGSRVYQRGHGNFCILNSCIWE